MNLYPKHFTSLPLNHLHIKMNFFLLIENFFFLYFNSLWIFFFSITLKTLDRRFFNFNLFSLIFHINNFSSKFLLTFFFMNLIAHREWQAQKRNVCSSWSLTRNWAAEREFSLAVCFFRFHSEKKVIGMRTGVSLSCLICWREIAITILY